MASGTGEAHVLRMTVPPASRPEVWLRGPVEGVPPALQPVAHALLQAQEDVGPLARSLDVDLLWASPGGAAPAGFHLRHMAGSLERLLAYARGDALTEAQRARLAAEQEPTPAVDASTLLAELDARVDEALAQLRRTDTPTLDDVRLVGRAGHPSTVRGLLHHAAEHTARHAGQLATTVRVLTGLRHQDR